MIDPEHVQCVFAFDRDDCVSSSPKTGPVPIEWVRYLAHETQHEVWATGSQKLKPEAEIPGTEEMVELFLDRWGHPDDFMRYRSNPKIETPDGLPADAPAPDIVTAVRSHIDSEIGIDYVDRWGGELDRQQRVRLLGALFPDDDFHLVIDNKHLGYVEGWVHLYPQQFVDFVRTFTPLEDLASPEAIDLPPYYSWADEWKEQRESAPTE